MKLFTVYDVYNRLIFICLQHLWRSKIQINGFINTDRRRNVRKDRCRDYRYHWDELWGDTEEDHDFNPDHYEDIFELRRLFGIFPYLPYTCEKEKLWI